MWGDVLINIFNAAEEYCTASKFDSLSGLENETDSGRVYINFGFHYHKCNLDTIDFLLRSDCLNRENNILC